MYSYFATVMIKMVSMCFLKFSFCKEMKYKMMLFFKNVFKIIIDNISEGWN